MGEETQITNEDNESDKSSQSDISRRDLAKLSLAAGLAVAAGSASAAALMVVETDVEVKTPDGVCDAAFIHPTKGSHPGVLI